MKIQVRKMVTMAILAALSLVLISFTRFPILPAAPYLKYDAADIPFLIGGFVYGPVAGLLITLVATFIQAMTYDAGDGLVGFAMHFIASGTLVVVSSLIYTKMKTFKGAIIGLILGCLSMIAIMIPANLIISTNFYGMTYQAVLAMLVPVLIPFNAIKSVANSILVMIVYKSLRRVIR